MQHESEEFVAGCRRLRGGMRIIGLMTPLLHLRQFAEPDNRYRVTVELERQGYLRRTAESRFELPHHGLDKCV